jgi:hypothetical protein
MILNPAHSQHWHAWTLSDPLTGVILYVGCARVHEIIQFTELKKHPDFKIDMVYKVEIMPARFRLTEARNDQAGIINNQCNGKRPIYNWLDLARAHKVIQCNQTGITYRTQSDCANALGLSQGQLSKHLKRLKGHNTIGGLSFSYVDKLDNQPLP